MMQAWMRAALKRNVDRFLTERGSLVANAPTTDVYGGAIETSVSVEAAVPVRIIQPGTSDNLAGMVGAAESLRNTHRIVAQQGTGLAADQQWSVNGITWYVVQVVTDLTDDLFEMAVVTRQR